MGKSQLIEELGRRLDVRPISAQRFIASGNPGRFHFPGKPLLIDGLDEAMARRDSDAVDMVLGKLEDAGHPDFILCCRSREWQSRNVVNLAQIYGSAPSILTIEAFTRFDAFAFMRQLYPELDVDHVLDHLEDQGIAELYHNPLTLSLIGKVAVADRTLPATRGGLFERVCTLLWPEHDPHRIDGALGLLSEEQALSAAGALCAGLLLASGDAISRSGPNHLVVGDVRLAELSELPEAEAAQAVFFLKTVPDGWPGTGKAHTSRGCRVSRGSMAVKGRNNHSSTEESARSVSHRRQCACEFARPARVVVLPQPSYVICGDCSRSIWRVAVWRDGEPHCRASSKHARRAYIPVANRSIFLDPRIGAVIRPVA